VVAQKVGDTSGAYTVDHSAGSYLFDKSGKLRVYEAYGTPADSLTHDIRQLLR
jgi:protein SCO1/2